MFWHLGRRIAFIVGIRGVLSIGVSVRTDHIDARRKCRFRFHFNATRTNFPPLNREERSCRIGHQIVGFGQLIDCAGNNNGTIVRDVFHARFVLLTFRRSENITIRSRLRSWFKRFTIAEIRCYAVIEQIVNTTTPSELFIIPGILSSSHAVERVLLRPIVTATEGNKHFIPLHLILDVQTSLFLLVQHLISA